MEVRKSFPQTSEIQRDLRSSIPCQFHAQRRCRNGTSCPYSHEESQETGIATRGAGLHSGITPRVDLRSQVPCQFYLRGACSKGDECLFAHVVSKNVRETTEVTDIPCMPSQVPCQFYLRGACKKGDECPFAHDVFNVKETTEVTEIPCMPSQVPCQFYLRGACKKGDECPFAHVVSKNVKETTEVTEIPCLPSQVPCQFYLRGACKKGDECPFAHVVSKNVKETTEVTEIPCMPNGYPCEVEDSEPETWCRELRGALVNFGDGAVTTKVSFPSDFSAVHISQLPQDTTKASVVELLASFGFQVSEACVRVPPSVDKSYRSADVTVEDPQFAKRLCDLPVLKRPDALVKVVPINAVMPQSTNYRRVDSKKVYCSWHKPTKTAWLNFGNEDIAEKVGSLFSNGICKILGQNVQSKGPKRGDGLKNLFRWTITLLDIPLPATEKDISYDIPIRLQPRHIEVGLPSYDADLPLANTLIESLLLHSGPLERWERSTESGKRFKAKARFMFEADARQAVEKLNNHLLPFNKNGKLTVKLVHSARLKVSARVYNAVEQVITEHKRVWDSQHLLFMAYPPDRGLRVLKIEGEVSRDVASAKATLEKTLDGDVMMEGGEVIWATSFASNGPAYQRIKQLERELGIVIVRDKRKSQLRLVGHKPRCADARRKLIEVAQEDLSSVFVIELDAQKLSWAFQGGYRAVATAIGNDKITLDIVSTPKRILVAGSEADFNAAKEIIHGGERMPKAKPEASSVSECAICWTEAENPVQTSCKHIYCAGCFEDLCHAGASTVGSDPCVRCQGDTGKCGELLPLNDLKAHLSSAALEDIFEAALTAHVARHPNDLRYCSTPDCGEIYRAVNPSERDDLFRASLGKSLLFICPVCLVAVCRACHFSHEGLSCAQHRDQDSGDKALQEAKKEYGIKDCPKCGTMIQKMSGCNHMTCWACKEHICWVCLKTFSTSGPVYEHMRKQHGGIGV